jgi:hypothetical protein
VVFDAGTLFVEWSWIIGLTVLDRLSEAEHVTSATRSFGHIDVHVGGPISLDPAAGLGSLTLEWQEQLAMALITMIERRGRDTEPPLDEAVTRKMRERLGLAG